MKKFGKLMAAVLVIVAILTTMCLPAMAEEAPATITTPSANDKADVKITGVKEGAKVTFYRIVDPQYTENGFTGYAAKEVDGTKIANVTAPTQVEIEAIWKALKAGTTTDLTAEGPVTVGADGIAKATVGAGMWMAIVTESDDTIYNPMIVSVNYKTDDGKTIMSGAEIAADSKLHLNGADLYAKSSKPTVDKKVNGADETSASVGDVVTYSVKVDVPSYPADAANKTFYLKDTRSSGLTLDAASIEITGLTRDGNEFKNADGKVVAKLAVKDNTFYINFDYANVTGTDYTVTYSARVNDEAVVGGAGNANTADLNYTNDPTKGKTYDPTDNPDKPGEPKDPSDEEKEQNGIKTDTETIPVYTYQLAFKKVDENGNPLAGAKFAIKSGNDVVDIVTTDANGYAVSTKVKEGSYKVVEIEAPAGYSLNTQEYEIAATKNGTQITATTTKTEYTSKVDEAADKAQVGWLLNDVFYTSKPSEDAVPAYVKTVTKTSTFTTGTATAGGTFLLNTEIPNTKVGTLPSTGGMGTTLFVVGGIALMALAIALIAANKRRAESK